jgi:hypothetical protein
MPSSELEDFPRHTPRLRTMVESWERDGIICADVAARALTPERQQPGHGARAQRRRGPLPWLGRRAAGPKTHEVVLNDHSVRQVARSR